ncbi:hypothetical protein NLI96_g11585 [Meripilus lineatus]|uniref:Uncharacterized protein n=1 Tax=Meripilus lineatus TaxID=2056292 RepID=A0AAD5UT26_9APHY|nr:hypothetical protein NLI96_g11585 [Physisporinus lineatus]
MRAFVSLTRWAKSRFLQPVNVDEKALFMDLRFNLKLPFCALLYRTMRNIAKSGRTLVPSELEWEAEMDFLVIRSQGQDYELKKHHGSQ